MAVWTRHGPYLVRAEGAVIRADDYATLQEIEALAERAEAERARLLDEVDAKARAMIQNAQEQAQRLLEDARARLAESTTRGREEGLQRAADEWAGQVLDEAAARQRMLKRQADRLSGIVATAVERIVEEQDRAALIRQALKTVGKLTADASLLTLRVAAQDRDAAAAAVVGAPVDVEVVVDPSLASGACLFESDRGVVDASLHTQLTAIRRAVARAVDALVQDDAEASDGETAAPRHTGPDQGSRGQ